jgi:YD repeat-containing protein
MIKSSLLGLGLLLAGSSGAQYYYKDIIGTRETAELMKTYQANKVNRVVLSSFDAKNTKSEDFFVEQKYLPATRTLQTITRSGVSNESILLSYINDAGQVVQTVDSSETLVSRTEYQYDGSGQLVAVVSTSTDALKQSSLTEAHYWQYEGSKPKRMLRVKNGVDTTVIDFNLDAKGNVIEETSTRKGVRSEPVQYYYDEQNRLTDVVRYNPKARKLLPEYMFSYSDNNQLIQKITVPAHSSDYLIWRFRYDEKGLKTKEAVYNKQKQLTGTIEYQYSFGS